MISETQIINELLKFDDSLIELGESVADDRYEKLEEKIGFTLPASFKSLLKKFNFISLYGTSINGLDAKFRDTSLDRLYEIEHYEVGNPMPNELFPFSADGYGNHYCFDLTNKYDKVLFWQHDIDYTNKSEIEVDNESFLEWINEIMIESTLEDYNYDGSEK
jgi:cell wall assembly regulator SMI1